MFIDKINLRLQKGGFVEPPVYGPGLLEWNTGLDHWTELFSFFGQVSEFIFWKPTFYDL